MYSILLAFVLPDNMKIAHFSVLKSDFWLLWKLYGEREGMVARVYLNSFSPAGNYSINLSQYMCERREHDGVTCLDYR